MWEKEISINDIREIRSRTTAYLGVGAIRKIDDIVGDLVSRGITRVLCVTGRGSYRSTGAWDYVLEAFQKHGVQHILYDRITPNPTADCVDEAVEMAREFGARGIIAIGGGSPIDAAKSAAILLEYPDQNARSLYELTFMPLKAVPLVAINLTHGTGTEVDRFAVVSIPEKEYKPAIAYDCIYPLYAIDDPGLMTKLSPEQTRYVSIDAINHVVEAATSQMASPFSILFARETVRLVARYLPRVLASPEDMEARYYLLYASMIAGMSFDNGLLHFTHALEHPLSAVKPDLAHGLGLAMLLPVVIREIYAARPGTLASILEPLTGPLKGDSGEALEAAKKVEAWLASVGVSSKLGDEGYEKSQVGRLADLAMTTPSLDGLLGIAPVEATREVIERIYADSFAPLGNA